MGWISDRELSSHGSVDLTFFLRKLSNKNILQYTNERNCLDDKILCFLILEFGEPRDHEVFCNLISCNELLRFLVFLENSNCINHLSYENDKNGRVFKVSFRNVELPNI